MRKTYEIGNLKDAKFLKKSNDSACFIGTSGTGKEIWLTKQMMRQHMLVSGTTGSGKTEFLLSLLLNSFANGGGGIFVDGKGDISLHARVLAMAEQFNRRDDVYVLNFMNRRNNLGDTASNTINPFQYMASDAITNLLVSLMDDVGSDGAMWKGRAVAMFTGVIRVLVWLRDNEAQPLDVGVVRDSLNLKKLIAFADPANYPTLPANIRKTVKSYLFSLPGFHEDKGYKQSQTTFDQHGYLEMQWTRMLGMMADVYGDIFNSRDIDIDIRDIVENRRILVVLLPALEKSGDEVANLGKFVVSIIKAMAGASLGSEISGSWQDVVEQRKKTQSAPFTCIFDEVSHYMIDGLDLMAAQARSLNFNLVFATQEIGMMLRKNFNVANNIIANCATKIMLQTNEPRVNSALAFLDLYNSRHMARYGSIFSRIRRALSNSFTEPVPLHDMLRNLAPGEFFITHRDAAVFVNGTITNFDLKQDLAPNTYYSHHGAADEILKIIKPTISTKLFSVPLEPQLPDALRSLSELNEIDALPGGHVFLSAALKALAEITDDVPKFSAYSKAADEIMEIGV